MQFNNNITRKVAEEAAKIMAEALKGNQHKIDKNKNNKVDAEDFKILRGEKKAPVKEETEEIEEASKEEEGKFHNKLDKLVHKTFGKSSDEKKMKEEVELDEALWPGTPEYEKKFPKDSKPGQRRKEQDYGYQGKEEEHGETSFKKEVKPAKRGKYGARQNYVRSRKISGKQLKDDVEVGFTDILEAYDSHGLKFIAAMMKEEPDNEQFTKEVEEQKKRDKGEIRNDKGVAKPLQSASVREEPVNPVREEVQLSEEMSHSELADHHATLAKKYYKKSEEYENRGNSVDADHFGEVGMKHAEAHYAHKEAAESNDPEKSKEAHKASRVANSYDVSESVVEEVEQLDEIGALLGGALGAIGAVAGGAGMAIHAAHKLASAAMGPKSSGGIDKGINDAKKAGDHKLYHSLKAHDHAQEAVKRAKAADEIKNNPASYHKTDNTKGKKGEMKSNAKMNYDTHVRASQEHAKKAKEYSAKEKSGAKISESTIDERTLTEPEKAKKEEIVKSMKKNMKGFKERYGERGKSVAYATATKIAKEKA